MNSKKMNPTCREIASSDGAMINLFVYGTLMYPEVAHCLAGKLNPGNRASVFGFKRFEATLRSRGNFPFVQFATPDSCVDGLILTEISSRQLAIFDWFEAEGALYQRIDLPIDQIKTSGKQKLESYLAARPTAIYVIGPQLEKAIKRYATANDREFEFKHWDPEKFETRHLAWYFWNTVLPTIEDPAFVRKFGNPADPDFVSDLKVRFANEEFSQP